MIKKYEGKRPPSLDLFLSCIGISEEEFLRIAMSHGVSPYKHNPSHVTEGKKTKDFDEWCRDGAMSKEEAKIMVDRWNQRNSPQLRGE